jgi:hypothetical protein
VWGRGGISGHEMEVSNNNNGSNYSFVTIYISVLLLFSASTQKALWLAPFQKNFRNYESYYTHSVGFLGWGSAHLKACTYKRQHNTQQRGQISVSRVEFAATIPVQLKFKYNFLAFSN